MFARIYSFDVIVRQKKIIKMIKCETFKLLVTFPCLKFRSRGLLCTNLRGPTVKDHPFD